MITMINILIAVMLTISLVVFLITYTLSLKKEKVKEYREINQQFILPYLNDVLLYIESETSHLKGHGVEFEIKPEKTINAIQNKISYGNAKLLNALYRFRNMENYFNGRGEATTLSIYEVFFNYLNYAYENLVKSKYADDYLLENIIKNQKIYGIAFILTTILGKDEALIVLSYKFLWTEAFLEKLSINLLEDLIDNYNNGEMQEHKLLMFLNTLQSDLDEVNENERFAEIKDYINEAITSVNDRWVNFNS